MFNSSAIIKTKANTLTIIFVVAMVRSFVQMFNFRFRATIFCHKSGTVLGRFILSYSNNVIIVILAKYYLIRKHLIRICCFLV